MNHRKSKRRGESKRDHVMRTATETRRFEEAYDAYHGVGRNWIGMRRRPDDRVRLPSVGGKSRFPAGGTAVSHVSTFKWR
jgi:hypothetical protein